MLYLTPPNKSLLLKIVFHYTSFLSVLTLEGEGEFPANGYPQLSPLSPQTRTVKDLVRDNFAPTLLGAFLSFH